MVSNSVGPGFECEIVSIVNGEFEISLQSKESQVKQCTMNDIK